MLSALLLSLAVPQLAAAKAPAPAAPAGAQAAAPVEGGLAFSGKTEMVEGPALQVVFGQRAVFSLDDKGAPVLESADKGALALAHPAGAVKESFAPPGAGKLAVALDGSPEKGASYLKVWNGLDRPVIYHAGVLAYVNGKLSPATVKVCVVPARGTYVQTWPTPVVAAVVANFSPAPAGGGCR